MKMKKVLPIVKKIFNMSIKEAKLYDDFEVKIEHVMISIINNYDNIAIRILEDMGIDVDLLHKKIESKLIKKKPNNLENFTIDIPLNKMTEEIIKNAENECDLLKDKYLDIPHIVLSILSKKNNVNTILKTMKVTYKEYQKEVKKHIVQNAFESADNNDEDSFKKNKKNTKNGKTNATPILDNFSTDLTKRASEGRIDPVIGRDEPIQRVAQILARKKKNNPVLIGEPGVGKCFTSDTEVVIKNDITGEVFKINIDEFIKTFTKP